MASITPNNGRVNFVSTWDPHTYWELNSTNLGTNYGDDNTAGGGDNTAVASGDISTQESYDGMNNQNDPPANGQFDVDLINDAACLLYIPAGLAHNTVRGLFHNGGGTNAQGAFLRATTTGVEIALAHNNGGDLGDYLIEEIPDADLPGWFCVSFQYNSYGGTEGDCALWLNGTAVRSGTRVYTLDYGSGNPDFGNNNGREPNASQVLDPSSYSGGDWGGNNSINGTGILIANFACDNPSGGASDTSAGNGNTWHTDYYDEHTSSSVDDLLANDVESASEVTTPTLGQVQALTSVDVSSLSEVGAPSVGQSHSINAADVQSVSEVGTPSISQTSALTANDVQSTSEVTNPSVSQAHSLLSSDIESLAEVENPSLGQAQSLLANDAESASEVGNPTLTESHALTSSSIESTSEVGTPTVTQAHAIAAADIESVSSVDTPSISQAHGLLSASIESASEVSTPTLAIGVHDLLANDIESASEVSSATVGQIHALLSTDIASSSTVSTPSLNSGSQGIVDHCINYGWRRNRTRGLRRV